MTLIITHTHEAGTLIEGTAKGDGTAPILKEHRWRWGRSISSWHLPQSRDRLPQTWKIDDTKASLERAGFQVELDIDTTARSTAEVEADKRARQEDRVDALEAKASRKESESDALYDRAHGMAERIPFGQPMMPGHHSYNRDRNFRDKIARTYERSFQAGEEGTTARAKADAASHTTDHRYSPISVARRIERLATDIRGYQRQLDGSSHNFGGGYIETKEPLAMGAWRDRTVGLLAEAKDQHDYWVAVRASQVADGLTNDYSKDTISKGDEVLIRGDWCVVLRTNAKTVSTGWGARPNGEPWLPGTRTTPYAELKGVRQPVKELEL